MKKPVRYDYLGRRLKIQNLLKTENIEKAFYDMYCLDSLSAPEISEKLASAGIQFSARSIQRILRSGGVIRAKGDAFRLAAKRGRVQWAYKDPRFKARSRKAQTTEQNGFKCVMCGAETSTPILEVEHRKQAHS